MNTDTDRLNWLLLDLELSGIGNFDIDEATTELKGWDNDESEDAFDGHYLKACRMAIDSELRK